MDSLSSHQAAERALLRVKYDKAVSDILNALDSDPEAAYSADKLKKLGVELRLFDPQDSKFLESEECLFKPVSSEELEEWSLDESDLAGGAGSYYFRFDEIYNRPTGGKNPPSESYIINQRAEQIFYYLDTYYRHLERKNGRDLEFFNDIYGWDQIQDGNSFEDGPMGLFYGLPHRNRLPDWDVPAICEWQNDCDDTETISPHIMLVTCTGAEAKDSELLFGELGPIVQAIRNRLKQKEFEKTSLFPVLAVSLFGPRHGRLLQAKFMKSGILMVRASSIYSFVRKAEAPWNLFLRFYACVPRDGTEYEFYSDDEEEEDEVAPAKDPEYVAPSPESDKENIPPKSDDDTSSFEP